MASISGKLFTTIGIEFKSVLNTCNTKKDILGCKTVERSQTQMTRFQLTQ